MDVLAGQHTDAETGEDKRCVFPLVLLFSPERLTQVITSVTLGHPDNTAVHTAFFILRGSAYKCMSVSISPGMCAVISPPRNKVLWQTNCVVQLTCDIWHLLPRVKRQVSW